MLDNLLEYNQSWSKEKQKVDPDFFKQHIHSQTPEILMISCVDSRVLPNALTGLGTGELFIHRNIANIVSEEDTSLMATIQYAIEVLKVKHIIVCGHYGCGGVKAAMDQQAPNNVKKWISPIEMLAKESENILKPINNEEEQWNKMVEINTLKQVKTLNNLPVVQASLKAKKLTIHGWVYNIKDGLVMQLY